MQPASGTGDPGSGTKSRRAGGLAVAGGVVLLVALAAVASSSDSGAGDGPGAAANVEDSGVGRPPMPDVRLVAVAGAIGLALAGGLVAVALRADPEDSKR